MKHLNKQILEAIQRGINIALDDYEDDIISTQKVGKTADPNWCKDLLKQIFKKIERKEEPMTEEDIKNLQAWYRPAGIKYTVQCREELYELVRLCMEFDPCIDLNWIDTSKITDMLEIFADTPFNGDISEWDVSHVKTMASMFRNCTEFTGENTDLSNWNTKEVLNMSYMFFTCSFHGIHNDLANWNVSKVGLMESMFGYSLFNSDISKWNTAKLTNVRHMFIYSQFNQPIGNWNVSNINDSVCMFAHNQVFNQDLTNWDGKNLSISTFKYSALDLNHLPKYWQDDIKMHPQTQWK